MFPVAFDKFKLYTNLEEIVLENLKKTAPETYQHRRSKIVEKHCKLVYEQFYENEQKREKVFYYGLALKPMPKSFREKIMQWPESGGASGTCSTTHPPTEKTLNTQSIEKKSEEEVPSCGTGKARNEHSNKPIAKKSNHPLKEKSEHDHPPVHKLPAKTRNSLQKENISKIQNKLPETVQPEITKFFAAISLEPKNNTECVEKQKVLKRKSDSPKTTSHVEPKSKRSKDFQHINLDNEQKNTKSKPESRQGKVLPKPTTNNRGKTDSKKPKPKCKQKKSSEDLRSDDSIIETSEIEFDPTVSASEAKTLYEKTLPNRKKPKPKSRQKKSSDDPKSENAIIQTSDVVVEPIDSNSKAKSPDVSNSKTPEPKTQQKNAPDDFNSDDANIQTSIIAPHPIALISKVKSPMEIKLSNNKKPTTRVTFFQTSGIAPHPIALNSTVKSPIETKLPNSKESEHKSLQIISSDETNSDINGVEIDPLDLNGAVYSPIHTKIRHRIKSSNSSNISHNKFNVDIINLTDDSTTSKNGPDNRSSRSQGKSPLPKRNRNEDNRKPLIEKLNQEEQTSATLCFPDQQTQRISEKDIEMWIEKGQRALAEASNETDREQSKPNRFSKEIIMKVDKLRAINSYPEEVQRYIKYLSRMEIVKGKNREVTNKPSKTYIETALSQITYEEYKQLIDAEKLISYRLSAGECIESIENYLKKFYYLYIKKRNNWPTESHIKLAKLEAFLISKNLGVGIQLKDIPPAILSFEEALEKTNIKECTSLNCPKPPESYQNLLVSAKKTYNDCCAAGVWNRGIKLINSNNGEEESQLSMENSIQLFSESVSMAPLEVTPSDVETNVQASINQHGDERAAHMANDRSEKINCDVTRIDASFEQHNECDRSNEPKTDRVKNDGKQIEKNLNKSIEKSIQSVEMVLAAPMSTLELEHVLTRTQDLHTQPSQRPEENYEQWVQSQIKCSEMLKNPANETKSQSTTPMSTLELQRVLTRTQDLQTQSSKQNEVSYQQPEVLGNAQSTTKEVTTNLNRAIEQSFETMPKTPMSTLELERVLTRTQDSQTKPSLQTEENFEQPVQSVINKDLVNSTLKGTKLQPKPNQVNQKEKKLETTSKEIQIPPSPNLFPYSSESDQNLPTQDVTYLGILANEASKVISEKQPLLNSNTKETLTLSPNLFQSSGESDSKCPAPQQQKVQFPEVVYVSCDRSINLNTEEFNYSVQKIEQASQNQDPFSDTVLEKEDSNLLQKQLPIDHELTRMIQQTDFTQQTADPRREEETQSEFNAPKERNLTHQTSTTTEETNAPSGLSISARVDVKQEIFSQYDDDVEIIDKFLSEPMLIDDEETAPELIDMLLSGPNKDTRTKPLIGSLSHLATTSSYFENFPQAQQMSSNFNLTQIDSVVDQSSNVQNERNPSTHTDAKNGKNIAVEKIGQVVSKITKRKLNKKKDDTLNNPPQDQNSNPSDSKSLELSKNSIPIAGGVKRNKLPSNLHTSIDNRGSSEENPIDESSEEVGHISIQPQNIPSDIELTQSSSNHSKNPSQDDSNKLVQLSGEIALANDCSSSLVTHDGHVENSNQRSTLTQKGKESDLNHENSLLICINQKGDVSKVVEESEQSNGKRNEKPKDIVTSNPIPIQDATDKTKTVKMSTKISKTTTESTSVGEEGMIFGPGDELDIESVLTELLEDSQGDQMQTLPIETIENTNDFCEFIENTILNCNHCPIDLKKDVSSSGSEDFDVIYVTDNESDEYNIEGLRPPTQSKGKSISEKISEEVNSTNMTNMTVKQINELEKDKEIKSERIICHEEPLYPASISIATVSTCEGNLVICDSVNEEAKNEGFGTQEVEVMEVNPLDDMETQTIDSITLDEYLLKDQARNDISAKEIKNEYSNNNESENDGVIVLDITSNELQENANITECFSHNEDNIENKNARSEELPVIKSFYENFMVSKNAVSLHKENPLIKAVAKVGESSNLNVVDLESERENKSRNEVMIPSGIEKNAVTETNDKNAQEIPTSNINLQRRRHLIESKERAVDDRVQNVVESPALLTQKKSKQSAENDLQQASEQTTHLESKDTNRNSGEKGKNKLSCCDSEQTFNDLDSSVELIESSDDNDDNDTALSIPDKSHSCLSDTENTDTNDFATFKDHLSTENTKRKDPNGKNPTDKSLQSLEKNPEKISAESQTYFESHQETEDTTSSNYAITSTQLEHPVSITNIENVITNDNLAEDDSVELVEMSTICEGPVDEMSDDENVENEQARNSKSCPSDGSFNVSEKNVAKEVDSLENIDDEEDVEDLPDAQRSPKLVARDLDDTTTCVGSTKSLNAAELTSACSEEIQDSNPTDARENTKPNETALPEGASCDINVDTNETSDVELLETSVGMDSVETDKELQANSKINLNDINSALKEVSISPNQQLASNCKDSELVKTQKETQTNLITSEAEVVVNPFFGKQRMSCNTEPSIEIQSNKCIDTRNARTQDVEVLPDFVSQKTTKEAEDVKNKKSKNPKDLRSAVEMASKLIFHGNKRTIRRSMSEEVYSLHSLKNIRLRNDIILNNELIRENPPGALQIPSKTSPLIESNETINTPPNIVLCQQQLNSTQLNTFTVQALIQLAALQKSTNQVPIEPSTVAEEGNPNDLVEVPLLVERRFLKSLPFQVHMREISKDSTIYAMNVNMDIKPKENLHSEEQKSLQQRELYSPTIPRIQYDERTVCELVEKTFKTTPENIDCIDSVTKGTVNCIEPVIVDKPIADPPQKRKSKPCPASKKKKTSPAKLAKITDFVPQKTHAFSSLPLIAGKKPASYKNREQTNPLRIEECDFLIEDASQVATTASQMLGTDCTYFENSELLRNLDGVPPVQSETPALKQHHPSLPSKEKVINLNPVILSEGVTARKVWQVNLQWKSAKKMSIEVRLSVNKHSITVCDESAKLLFNFTPGTWSHVCRILREIDHFEYKRIALKNQKVKPSPLHKVLRLLFDSASQVVNVRMINDSFSPFTMCEKVKPVYRKPLQCLTKGIPSNILNRMKALKENLQNNNLEEQI